MSKKIRVDRITRNPYQRRQIDDEGIRKLADSILNDGQLNPVLLRHHPTREGDFQLVNGERRVMATKLLGLSEVEAFVRDLTEEEVARLTIIDNEQRQELNPIEKAESYQTMISRFNYSITQIARMTGQSRPAVSNLLRLLKLDLYALTSVRHQTISMNHALALLALPEEYETYLLIDLIIDWDLTIRETREAVKDIKEKSPTISWIREIPTAGVCIHPLYGKVNVEPSMKVVESVRESRYEPLDVHICGFILVGEGEYIALKRLGVSKARARIHFPRDLLRKDRVKTNKSENLEEGRSSSTSIFPGISEDRRPQILRFNKAIRRHLETNYPDEWAAAYKETRGR